MEKTRFIIKPEFIFKVELYHGEMLNIAKNKVTKLNTIIQTQIAYKIQLS